MGNYNTIEDIFGAEPSVVGTKVQSPLGGFNTIEDIFGSEKEDDELSEPIFESKVTGTGKLKKKDLYSTTNVNIIRDYMSRSKGEEYNKAEPDKVVEDFVDHMRWVNTNTVSTAGAVMFVSRGSQADKAAAGEAYKLYDRLGNVFTNDGIYGAVDGIKDYVFAAVSDPSNWVGALTGGVAKAGTLGVSQGAKNLMKKTASEAAMRAAKSGATKKAAKEAGDKAAEDLMEKLATQKFSQAETTAALDLIRANAKKDIVMRAASKATREVGKEAATEATKKAIRATTMIDAVVAGTQDVSLQSMYIDTGAQDRFHASQTAMSLFMGGIGGGMHYALTREAPGAKKVQDLITKGRGVDDLGEATAALGLEQRIKKGQSTGVFRSVVAKKAIINAFKSWDEKVTDGKAIMGGNFLPEGMMNEVLKGKDGKGGLVQILKDDGYTIDKDGDIADFLSNVIREMPQDDLKEINELFTRRFSTTIGEVADMRIPIADMFAAHASKIGGELSLYSYAKRELDSGIVVGNEIISQALNRKEVRDILEESAIPGLSKKTPKAASYVQNVWRRTLVSSLPTTAANVQGFVQYGMGQTVSDLLSGGAWRAYGALVGGGNTAKGREAIRIANVYKDIQVQKFRNFRDPFTTKDAYMAFLDNNKNVKSLLFETVGAGIERSANRYNIDPENATYKLMERYANGATQLTGVRAQDTFTKSQMFIGELDKHLRIKHDKSLSEVLSSGDLSLVDKDVVGLTLDTTMKSVFAKDYTTDDQMLQKAAQLVEDVSNIPVIGSIMPFGRFFNNVIATVHQWGPTSLLPGAARIAADTKAGRSIKQGIRNTFRKDPLDDPRLDVSLLKPTSKRIGDTEALSRSAVGTAALFMAVDFAAQQEEKGNDYNIIDVGGGARIDIKNAFPASEFLAMGKLGYEILKSYYSKADANGYYDQVTRESFEDAIQQLGVGQFARDLQFGNDMYKLLDMFNSEEGGPGMMAELYKRGGGYAAGFTRPLDTINKAVGFITKTDYAKDMRQAKGAEIFTLQSSRYFDNIIEAFLGEVDGISGERLRVSSREGDLYDPNPIASMFGIRVVPDQTTTEKVYSLAGMKGFRQDSRSKRAAYDKIFNETMAAPLNRELNRLLEDPKFIKGANTYKRARVKDILKNQKKIIREVMGVSSNESYIEKLKYDTINKAKTGEQFENAMRRMNEYFKKRGLKAKNIDDYEIRDIMQLQYFMEAYKFLDKGN